MRVIIELHFVHRWRAEPGAEGFQSCSPRGQIPEGPMLRARMAAGCASMRPR